MSELFIVIAYGGEWEDAWTDNRVVTYDEDKALAYIEKETLRIEKRNADVELWEEAYSKFYDTLEKIPYGKRMQKSAWPPGLGEKDITPEMREERERVNAHNENLDEIYHKAHREQNLKTKAFTKKFFVDLGYDENDDFIDGYCDPRKREVKFKIEKVELI